MSKEKKLLSVRFAQMSLISLGSVVILMRNIL